MDLSLPGSSVPGILQARILEWVAIFSSNHQVTLILKFMLINLELYEMTMFLILGNLKGPMSISVYNEFLQMNSMSQCLNS